jgi:hypothetical protein
LTKRQNGQERSKKVIGSMHPDTKVSLGGTGNMRADAGSIDACDLILAKEAGLFAQFVVAGQAEAGFKR